MKLTFKHTRQICLIEELPDRPEEQPFFIWNGKAKREENKSSSECCIVWEGPSKEEGCVWAKENNLEIEVFIPLDTVKEA